MANLKKLVEKLGLRDLGKSEILRIGGNDKCPECGTELRLGEDQNKYQWSYCPKCQKKIKTIAIPRFQPGIKVEPHDEREIEELGIQTGGVKKLSPRIIGPGGKGLPDDAYERRM